MNDINDQPFCFDEHSKITQHIIYRWRVWSFHSSKKKSLFNFGYKFNFLSQGTWIYVKFTILCRYGFVYHECSTARYNLQVWLGHFKYQVLTAKFHPSHMFLRWPYVIDGMFQELTNSVICTKLTQVFISHRLYTQTDSHTPAAGMCKQRFSLIEIVSDYLVMNYIFVCFCFLIICTICQ